MGLLNKLLGEFVDIIEWVDTTHDTIVWKFPRYQDEIKMGAKLTVRESQVAIFMNEGIIADVYQPGMYTLSTENMPLLSTLRGWKYGFNSPFKVDVFFVSTRQFTDQRWGTKNPVMVRDAEFGPVRLRAFGSYAFRVSDARQFLKEVAATQPGFKVEDINDQLRNIAVSRGMDAIASSGLGILDLTANYDDVSETILHRIQPDFTELGLSLTKFLIENISLPPEVEAIMDKRTGMGIVGNLGAFAQFQAANAMEKAAENPGGGLAGAGLGLGMGAGMMGQVGDIFRNNQAGATPPPVPDACPSYYFAVNGNRQGPYDMNTLRNMIQNGTVTRDTLAWKQGMDNWAAAGTLTDLSPLFSTVPPPLPPQ